MDNEIEARLIEQEHRLVPVVANLIRAKSYDSNDPRRIASIKAMIHKMLFGGTATLAFGGVIAWATLYYTSVQTDALLHQNELLSKEIEISRKNAEDQRWIENLGRRTELLNVLYAQSASSKPATIGVDRLKSEALVEYVELQDLIARTSRERFLSGGGIPRDTAMYKFGIDLTGANMQGISISQIDFSRAVMHQANLEGAKLFSSSFVDVPLDWAELSGADLRFVDVSGASLLGANLTNAFLGGLKWNDDTKVYMANIHGVREPPEGFVHWALNNGAVDEPNYDKWVADREKLKHEP